MRKSLRPRIWFSRGCLDQIELEATAKSTNETGGILVGYSLKKRGQPRDFVVTQVIGPGPNAVHNPAGFIPDAAWQCSELAYAYAESGQTLAYLGDWHTHPGGSPRPSSQDVLTLGTIARSEEARCPNPVMLIVGGTSSSPRDAWAAVCLRRSHPLLLPMLQRIDIRVFDQEDDTRRRI